MIEIIKTKKKWDSFLDEVDYYDFYHTYDYHELSLNKDEECILMLYTENESKLGLPFIVRNISNSEFKDITSVYGYAGPISKNVNENFNNEKFSKSLYDCLTELKIVSVFSRLNPFIPHQYNVLKNIGHIETTGKIVNIDLDQDLDLQRKNYQRRIKSQINKARRLCDVKKSSSKEEMLEFIDIYYENMDRVEARESYYFNKEYFYKFLESNSLNTDFLIVTLKETGEIIAGGLFVKTNNIVQYHLSGTKEEHLDLTPLKLLIDEMRIISTNENFNHFNLGGGYGSKDDSLLRFKMSFSKKLTDFQVWRYIVNQDVYDEFTNLKGTVASDYFPNYRDPN
ncbi:peptidoglycan bridge formation glycyltransferase FemA/FemB family protein [Psychroserpens sp. Hel_I_66]|uniref:peptidoglycan bridge formation glycyltransferase FemA/FemB family protein n=1 Tax=Psychroserpens sp. Hel_I_66 TaxID=1250004 RepID=UPI00064846A3|nr:peptidoglycan bridge formation glycyltransferase FemA/FemB family protein [Psychroserpens sp. Hel_I_66]